MENKQELTKILGNMLGVEGKILMTYTLDSGDERTYTLTERNAKAVMNGVVLDNEEYEQESDQEFKTFLRVQNIRKVKFDRVISKKKSGAFFKFTHNIEGLDLTDLQIFNERNKSFLFSSIITTWINDDTFFCIIIQYISVFLKGAKFKFLNLCHSNSFFLILQAKNHFFTLY